MEIQTVCHMLTAYNESGLKLEFLGFYILHLCGAPYQGVCVSTIIGTGKYYRVAWDWCVSHCMYVHRHWIMEESVFVRSVQCLGQQKPGNHWTSKQTNQN